MGWISRSSELSEEEMKNNANIVIETYQKMGISDVTISAILGNMQSESSINPGRYEDAGIGYGLVQWTPPTDLTNACQHLGLSPYTSGDIQLAVILSDVRNEIPGLPQWLSGAGSISPYYNSGVTSDMLGITGAQFLSNSIGWSPEKLAILFMACYLRPEYDPGTNHYTQRKANAAKWYEYIRGYSSFTPRLNSDGMQGNPCWYANNPFEQAGYGLPNCTAYAWGRW